MKKKLGTILALLLAVALVIGIGFMTSGNRLKASESDGNTKASDQQEEVKEKEKPETVDVPQKDEEKKEPSKEESAEEKPTEEEPSEAEPAEEVPAEETPVEEEQEESEKVTVKVNIENKGDIYYGDTVKLVAKVSGIDKEYKLQWQYNDGKGWKDLNEHGKTYKYTVTEENTDYDYRVKVIY